MDPWTIIGTTSAVLSFAEFAVAIVKTAVDINKSEDGASEDNKRLVEVSRNGQQLLAQMSEFKESQTGKVTLAPAEESMLATVEQCRLLGEKILMFLGKMQATNEGSFRSSLKAAAKEIWYKSTVKELNEQLHSCRTQLNTHLLVLIRSKIGKDFEQLLIMHSAQTSDISRLQGLVERLSRDQELGLAQIGQIAGIFALPDAILEDINRKRILMGLEFDQIEARHEQISQAAHDTFGWCISDEAVPRGQGLLNISLKQWLRSGHGIFHISAKPGGGKSTLMKMLARHGSTRSLLQTWAEDKMLVKANFFVWNAGVPLQKNLQGMVRTLLGQILRQASDLTQTLFPKYWRPRAFYPWMNLEGLKISPEDINFAIQCLLTDVDIAEHYRFCFFVDGLDEFEDQESKHTEISEYLQQWISHNPLGVKFCVSSREEPAFMNTFIPEQRLRLHLLTRSDVEAMVNERLAKHPWFREYNSVDRQAFALAVVTRAEGVFLWVHLLIKNELWDALDEGATVDELFTLLHKVPEELDQFFARVVSSIRKSNKQEAAMIFAVAIQTDGWRCPLRLFHYSFLEDFIKNPNFSFSLRPQEGRAREAMILRLDRFKRRLPGICKGLLENSKKDKRDLLVFAHRSIYDFLKTGPTENIKAAINDKVATASFLTQCLTAETKQYWDLQRSTRLGHVMDLLSSLPFDIRSLFAHLRHLDETLALHQSKLPLTDPKSMFNKDFLQLAAQNRHGYLSVYAFACLGQLRTYVDWARENYPSWILMERVGSEIFGAAMLCKLPRRQASITFILDVFLDPNGPSPVGNKKGNGSPWMIFLKDSLLHGSTTYGNLGFWSTFMAFLRHGADPFVHFQWRWREVGYAGGGRNRDLGVFHLRTDVEADDRGFAFTFGRCHESLMRFCGAHDRGRADLFDFARYLAPSNVDDIVGLVQASMEEVRRAAPKRTEIKETRDYLEKLQISKKT